VGTGEEQVYAAARLVLERGFVEDDSVFTPGRAVWTGKNAEDLAFRLEHPPPGPGSFLEKLRAELKGASPEVVQLAAEVLYLHLLPIQGMHGSTKRAALRAVFDESTGPLKLPADLDAVLDSGVIGVGIAYFRYRPAQVTWLVEVVIRLKGFPPSQRRDYLQGEWDFRDLLDQVPTTTAAGQRRALLHLAFPDVFLNSLRVDHPAAIMQVFGDQVSRSRPKADVEADFAEFWRLFREKHGSQRINFFDSPWREQWLSQTVDPEPAVPQLQGWLVRGANISRTNLVPEWLRDGYCSMSCPDYPDIPGGLSRTQLAQLVRQVEPGLRPSQEGVWIGLLDRFFNRMRANDLVVTVDGARIYVGVLTGEPVRVPETPLADRRRAVRWLNADKPIVRTDLSSAAQDRLRGQLTVSSLGDEVSEFLEMAQLETDDEEIGGLDLAGPGAAAGRKHDEEGFASEVRPALQELPRPTQRLADQLFVDLPWLAETVDLLNEKKQLVLYGPPGTGKTWLAQAVGDFLAQETNGEYRLVQFHPSYAYEDFVEGFRPSTAGDDSFRFAKEPGPFRKLVAAAEANPSGAYVLIIDEINRANLAKVFGELYFLLEYRQRSIQLQYSPDDEFKLPWNVFLIGTMNTADRSIALVDAAMRRRFAWQGLFPGEAPVAGMLRAWLEREGMPLHLVDLLEALNAKIADRDAAIGPSYLMNKRVATDAGLERIWRTEILPLLEERHLGEHADVPTYVRERYGLDVLLPTVTPQIPAQPEASTTGPAASDDGSAEAGEAQPAE